MDVLAEEMQTLGHEVCRLSFFGGRKDKRWGRLLGGGFFPDLLEPCCNSLIETEWDVLITLVVKTKGGEGGREGRMCALIFGLRESEMRRDASYKYSKLWLKGQSGLSLHLDTAANFWISQTPRTQHFLQVLPSQLKGSTLFWAPSGLEHSTAMRGHFSIEWMAQSSQAVETEAASGPTACGTHAESLPGFYCRPKFESSLEPEENRSQSLDSFSDQQTSLSIQGLCSPLLDDVLKNISVIYWIFVPVQLPTNIKYRTFLRMEKPREQC